MSGAQLPLPGQPLRSADFYPTPAWVTRTLLPYLPNRPATIAEPCLGKGAIARVLLDAGYQVEGSDVHAYDGIPKKVLRRFPRDARNAAEMLATYQHVDAIVTNPPFSISFEIAQALVATGRTTWLLLRLGWLGSSRRAPWLREHRPCLLVLSKRPSFTGGAADHSEYGWFGWNAGPPEVWFPEILK